MCNNSWGLSFKLAHTITSDFFNWGKPQSHPDLRQKIKDRENIFKHSREKKFFIYKRTSIGLLTDWNLVGYKRVGWYIQSTGGKKNPVNNILLDKAALQILKRDKHFYRQIKAKGVHQQ